MAKADIPWLNPDDLLRLKYCPHCDYCLRGLPTRHRCPECGFEYDEEMFDLYGWKSFGKYQLNVPYWFIGFALLIPFLFLVVFVILFNYMQTLPRYVSLLLPSLAFAISVINGISLIMMYRRRSDRRPSVQYLFTAHGYCGINKSGAFAIIPWTPTTCLEMDKFDRNRVAILIKNQALPLAVVGVSGWLELDSDSSQKVAAEINRRIKNAQGLT